MSFALLCISGAALSLLLMQIVLKVFPRLGLMDRPHLYNLTRAPLPYPAGMIIWIAFAIIAAIWVPLSGSPYIKELIGMLVGGTILCVVSAIDDHKHIPALARLGVQILIGLIIVVSGIGIGTITSPLGGVINLEMWQIPLQIGAITYHLTPLADLFTILWLCFVMNAVNFLDGIPGLVSGVGTIASTTLFLLSLFLISSPLTTALEKGDATTVAGMAIAFAGILFIFNRFDFPSPKVVIGDAGAMSIGYVLALLSIFAGGKVATMIIVLALPLMDMVWVALRRLSLGRSPLSADHNHYHHKLLRLGLSEKQTLLAIYGLSIILGVVSLLLLFWFKSSGKYVALLLVLLLIFGTSVLLIKKETRGARGF